MRRPPGWLQRLRHTSRDVVAAVRPHDHSAMFAPTCPVQRRPGRDQPRIVVVDSHAPLR